MHTKYTEATSLEFWKHGREIPIDIEDGRNGIFDTLTVADEVVLDSNRP